jgi:glutamate-1-semialdehyde 2,1-aminomutase
MNQAAEQSTLRHAASRAPAAVPGWESRALASLPGGGVNDFTPPAGHRVIASRGEGAYVWDVEGHRYSDYLLGSGPMVLGHAHPRVKERLIDQLGMGTTYYLPSTRAVELAEEIRQWMPTAEKVRYCSDGSEAVFYALRIARAQTGRELVLKFEGGFHGHTDYALQSFQPTAPANFPRPVADTLGIPRAVGTSVLVAPFNDLEATRAIMAEFGHQVAAILVEPVQRAIEPVPGFLPGLRELCDAHGAMLVFDEIVSGFRLCTGGAQQLYSVQADLYALGKALSGGLPLACVAGQDEAMRLAGHPNGAYVSGTLNGNPLSCSAALATLKVMGEIEGCDLIRERGTRLRAGFRSILDDLQIPGVLIGPPAYTELIIGRTSVTNYAEYRASDRRAVLEFGARMLAAGQLMRPGAKIYVSAVHTNEQIDTTLDCARSCLQGMLRGGSLRAEVAATS